MSWFVRSLILRVLSRGETNRQKEEAAVLRAEREKRQDEEFRSLLTQKQQEFINANKYSDKPMGAWYSHYYTTSNLGAMNIPMPEAVTKTEWARRFFIAYEKGNGVLPYRTMLDGWNPEWGDIHKELADEAFFYECHTKARYHSNPSKEFDRLRALPYEVRDYDPLLKIRFKYNSPCDEWQEQERIREEKRKKAQETEIYSGCLGCGTTVVMLALLAGLANGSVGVSGFIVLMPIILVVVYLLNEAIHKP